MMNPLLFCAAYGNEDSMDVLVTAGADQNVTDKAGLTVFHYACRSQNLRTLRFLVY